MPSFTIYINKKNSEKLKKKNKSELINQLLEIYFTKIAKL